MPKLPLYRTNPGQPVQLVGEVNIPDNERREELRLTENELRLALLATDLSEEIEKFGHCRTVVRERATGRIVAVVADPFDGYARFGPSRYEISEIQLPAYEKFLRGGK